MKLKKKEVRALAAVIDYLYDDEAKDYEESRPPCKGHIFHDIRKLRRAIVRKEGKLWK